MHFDEFAAKLKFTLDDFQIAGCTAIENDQGVLVCAPTGSGKTIIGEFAVSLALSRGTKCFYTTPIKALSNQKYHDLVKAHGEETVGLLTGDVSINHHADIIVMTTEVLRNMLYAQSPTLDSLSHVVMDEIHFLSDKSRGGVWEEVILNLDESVCLIGLSATVSNSEEFGNWLSTVRGDTTVIVSEHRPVPLDQYMLVSAKLYPLFDDPTGTVNPDLVAHIDRIEGDELSHGRQTYLSGRDFRGHNKTLPEKKFRPLGRPEVITILKNHQMLPAITFIFSRLGCDSAVAQCMRSKLVLTTQQEAEEISRIIDDGSTGIPEEDLKVLGFRQFRAALMRGFAAHHAGMLPAFRHIVEKLFVNGLLKAVFATETLALGINMPARTVLLEKLTKFDGEGHVELTPGQYTQLTGRAGRRGIDILGNAVIQWSPAMDPTRVAGLASTRTYPLISTFTPGYNMSVNLLKTIGYEPAHRLLEKSFAQFQADGSVVDDIREIERAEKRTTKLRDQLELQLKQTNVPSENPLEELQEYLQIRRDLTLEERRAKRHAIEQRQKEVQTVLTKLQTGEVIALPGKKKPILAVVAQPAHNSKDPKPLIIMESGWTGRVDVDSFAVAPIILGTMRLPRNVINNPKRGSKQVIRLFKQTHYHRPKKLKTTARQRTSKQTQALRAALKNHPTHYWPDLETLARTGEQLIKATEELTKLQSHVDNTTDTLGKEFDRIINLLSEMNYVEYHNNQPQVTDEGERLALIHNESDLLVAQCLKRGVWDNLDPAELAGVISLCTFENRRETRGEAVGATDPMVDAMNHTIRIWEELSYDERRHQLPITKEPEPAFALAIHQWAAGAPLGYCLAAAAESGAELTPGDFVRQARQVIDLLDQIRLTAYNDTTVYNARQAITAIRRGVVAIGS